VTIAKTLNEQRWFELMNGLGGGEMTSLHSITTVELEAIIETAQHEVERRKEDGNKSKH